MQIIDYANNSASLSVSVAESDCGRLIYFLDEVSVDGQASTGSFGWVGDLIPTDAEELKQRLRAEVDDYNRSIMPTLSPWRALHALAYAA